MPVYTGQLRRVRVRDSFVQGVCSPPPPDRLVTYGQKGYLVLNVFSPAGYPAKFISLLIAPLFKAERKGKDAVIPRGEAAWKEKAAEEGMGLQFGMQALQADTVL